MTGGTGQGSGRMRRNRPHVDMLEPITLNVQTAAMRALNGIRRQQGMSSLDLALASGVSEAAFSALMAGKRAASLRQVVQIADACGLAVVIVPKLAEGVE